MIKYNSHIKSLRIVITPAKPIFEGGIRTGDTQGKYAQFENGRYETNDERIIKKLESLSTFSIDFWRVTDEPAKTDEENKSAGPDLESMTRQELLQMAEEKGLEVNPQANKKELLELLKT